jgi:hypothetical protein
MPDQSQFNSDHADPGRWTITFSKPADQHVCSHNGSFGRGRCFAIPTFLQPVCNFKHHRIRRSL